MDRRAFLKWQMAAAAAVGAAPLVLSMERLAGATTIPPEVVIVKGPPGRATRSAVERLGGMGRFVKSGQKVIIKPNMSFAADLDSGCNTHPDVVRELVLMCREAGASRIRVLDHSLQNVERSLEMSGIREACDSVEPGICRHLMEESFYRDVQLPLAVEMRQNAVMTDVLEADVIIAAPAAKSHGGAGVSLSMKGQMGLVYNRGVMHSHYDLHTSITDLNTFIKPHLAVIDASRVLSSGGPGGPGLILKPGEIIASADPVAADAMTVASYTWYGRKMEPRQVRHILQAHERGLGRMDIENLKVFREAV